MQRSALMYLYPGGLTSVFIRLSLELAVPAPALFPYRPQSPHSWAIFIFSMVLLAGCGMSPTGTLTTTTSTAPTSEPATIVTAHTVSTEAITSNATLVSDAATVLITPTAPAMKATPLPSITSTTTKPSSTPSSGSVPATAPPLAGHPLPFTTLEQEVHLGGPRELERQLALFIIANIHEFEVFARDFVGLEPDVPMTENSDQRHRLVAGLRQLDYTHSFAIFVKGPSGGYNITVQQVFRQGTEVTLYATIYVPTPGLPTTANNREPYHVIAIPKEDSLGQQVHFTLVVNGTVAAESTHILR